MLRLFSWNVNGIRAAVKNGFFDWFNTEKPDILGIQEIKALPEQLSEVILSPEDYTSIWNPAKRRGYSGTALFSKIKPLSVKKGFGVKHFDNEGRTIIAEYEKFVLFNIYFPNGQKDDERLKYKLDFYDTFLEYAEGLRRDGKNIVVCGDFNTAHKEIDLANQKANEKNSGFLPVEREWIDKFISYGYTDTFRHFNPGLEKQYSWWTYRFSARDNNIGWRIDYFFVNDEFLPCVKDALILPDIKGSDHCPVGIILDV